MKRRTVRTLPSKMYGELYRLASACKLYGLRHFDELVVNDLRRIINGYAVRDDFTGWKESKLCRWFFDHFLRPIPNRPVAKRRREELYQASERARKVEEAMLLQRRLHEIELRKRAQEEAITGVPSIALKPPTLVHAVGAVATEKDIKEVAKTAYSYPDVPAVEPSVVKAEDMEAGTALLTDIGMLDTPTSSETRETALALEGNTTGVNSEEVDPEEPEERPAFGTGDVECDGNSERTNT